MEILKDQKIVFHADFTDKADFLSKMIDVRFAFA
jgi:hypothetical protein